jgi:predicted Holliday junction resolvase-like endonuclease
MDQVLLILFGLTLVVLVYLLYRYLVLKTSFERRVRDLFEQW